MPKHGKDGSMKNLEAQVKREEGDDHDIHDGGGDNSSPAWPGQDDSIS